VGQSGEPPLLAVIQRLVERIGGIGYLFHGRGRCGAHART
jgi:hypothetical protein